MLGYRTIGDDAESTTGIEIHLRLEPELEECVL